VNSKGIIGWRPKIGKRKGIKKKRKRKKKES
jgi:hypothetical protein